MISKAAQPVDVSVGSIIRQRRQMLGLSQTALADELGVTFQQVQKYEKGINRVSASRLHRIAEVLALPVSDLFKSVEPSAEAEDREVDDGSVSLVAFLSTSDALDLNRAFVRVTSPGVRRRLIDLVRQIARDEMEPCPLVNNESI